MEGCDSSDCVFKNMTSADAEIRIKKMVSEAVSESFCKIGLDGDTAPQDMKELRMLLGDWRNIKHGARASFMTFISTVYKGVSRIAALVLLWYIATKLGWSDPKAINKILP